jgi:poly-gamma-glutamate system protein
MRRRHGRVNRWVLIALAVVALGFYWLETRSARYVRGRAFEVKLAAARAAERGFAAAKTLRDSLGIPIDSVNDPNTTGLVGVQYSPLTQGRSDLSDALTTTNPNFGAALVELLERAGARPGDTIAVSWDGTYPALNIQVLAVAQAMSLTPIIVTTLSAGMWGANLPGWSWPDVEQELNGAGVCAARSSLALVGGEDDNGRGLSPEGRELLVAAAERADLPVTVVDSIQAGVNARMKAFGRVRAAVLVGRAVVHSGDPLQQSPSRLLRGRTDRLRSGGLVRALLEANVPVVNLANPSRVAVDFHLPVAPVPLPETGRGRLFYERRYSVWLAGAFAVVLLVLLWLVVRYDIESYLGVKRSTEENISV